MLRAPSLEIVVLPSLPAKVLSGWLGAIAVVLVMSLWVMSLQGSISQAWRLGQWWDVIWLSVGLVAIAAVGWQAKVTIFNYVVHGAANWARWRATRARGSDAPIDEWTQAWMSLIGCGVLALMPLAKVQKRDVERRYGVCLPHIIIEPGVQQMIEEMTKPLEAERVWVVHRVGKMWETVGVGVLMFMAPLACGVISAHIGTAAWGGMADMVLMWIGIGLFLAIPIGGHILIGRKVGTMRVHHALHGVELAYTLRSGVLRVPASEVLIGCAHFRTRSELMAITTPTLNAVITPTATTPAMRVVLNDPRAFIAALTAAGGHDRPIPSTLPSHDRPQGSA